MTQDDRMETITDPAAIRACDEPDERGDFPCCADRAHKESLGGDSESGTYNRSNRPPAGPCTDERTTPAPSSGAGPDLDAVEAEFLRQCGGCDAGLMVGCTCSQRDFRPTMLALVAEVRRLTARSLAAESVILDQRRMSADHDAFCRPATDRLVARAEAAEAEVVTLRAKVAAVEAVHVRCGEGVCNAGPKPEICHECGVAWPCPTFAALAVTTGEGE